MEKESESKDNNNDDYDDNKNDDNKNEDSKNGEKNENVRSRPRRGRIIAEEKTIIENNEAEIIQNDESLKPRRKRVAGREDDIADNGTENGGWMNLTKSDFSQKKIVDEEFEILPQAMNKDKHFQENNDDIMIIPDLDEDGTDTDQRIAHAPRNINRKIPTLLDLENEVKATVTSIDGGFDLGVLLSTFVPAALVLEADLPWTFESLLRDITDELTAPSKTVTETSIKPVISSTEKSKIPVSKIGNKSAAQDQQARN